MKASGKTVAVIAMKAATALRLATSASPERKSVLGSHIDERVVKHVAQLLTSNNVRDLDKGIKLISRNKTLFKAIQNADAAAGSVGTRGAVSGVMGSEGQ